MSSFDLLGTLRNHLALSSRAPKFTDKIKITVVLFLRASQPIFKWIPSLSASIEQKILNMVNCWGVIIRVNGVEYFLRDYESFLIVGSSFERWIWKHLKPQDGETFVDIGSHIGKYALQVAKQVGQRGQTIAIEADPDNFEALSKSIRINGLKNVRALNLAAWNKVDKLRLYRGISSGRASVKDDKWLGYVEVKAMPLDRVLKDSRVDWIKIDVEGAELETLEGLKCTLEEHHPEVIAEVTKCNTRKVLYFMRKRGYSAKAIYSGTTGDHILFSFGRARVYQKNRALLQSLTETRG